MGIGSNDHMNTDADDGAFEDALFKSEEEYEEALTPKKAAEKEPQAEQPKPAAPPKPQQPVEPENAYDHFLTEASRTFKLDAISHTAPAPLPPLVPIGDSSGRTSKKAESILTREISLKDILTTEIKVDGLKKSKGILTTEINVEKLLTTEISLTKSKRALPLDLNLPDPNPNLKVTTLPQTNQIQALFVKKGVKLNTIFEKAANDLSILSQLDTALEDRLTVLDTYSTPLISTIKSFISIYQKNPAIPDDPQRTSVLKHCKASLSHLLTGYKQVYSFLYTSQNSVYSANRETANKAAFRIIELISLEQQLNGALYRKMPAESVKTLNKVFNALTQCEPSFIAEQKKSIVSGNKVSIWELYLQIQLCLVFDLPSFSAAQHALLISYFRHNINSLKVISSDDFDDAPDNIKWIIPHNHTDAPVQTKKVNKNHLPAIFIIADNLLNQINADNYECLTLQSKKNPIHSCTVFNDYKLSESLALLDTLSALTRNIISNTTYKIPFEYKSIDLIFHSGFKRCIIHCQEKRRQRLGGNANDSSAQLKTQSYRIGDEDERNLYIQTTENADTVKMDIGWIVLATMRTKRGEKSVLTRIIRMERGEYNQVNIILEKMGSKIVDVIFPAIPGSTKQSNQLLLGIIATSKNNTYFVCPNNNPFWGGRKFKVKLPNRVLAPLKIDYLRVATNSFQIYKLI